MEEPAQEGPWNWDPKRAFRTAKERKKPLNPDVFRQERLLDAQREILLVLFSEKERNAFLSMGKTAQDKFVKKVFPGKNNR